MYASDHDRVRVRSPGGVRRGAQGVYLYGKAGQRIRGKDTGQLFCGPDSDLGDPDRGASDLEQGFPYGFRRQ